MLGYWKAPEETARALRNGWLYTGDIGHVDTDGYLYIVDRKKDMIKYKGFSIAPAELEAVLVEHPAVLELPLLVYLMRKLERYPRPLSSFKVTLAISSLMRS